jgi:hypothetical protein
MGVAETKAGYNIQSDKTLRFVHILNIIQQRARVLGFCGGQAVKIFSDVTEK